MEATHGPIWRITESGIMDAADNPVVVDGSMSKRDKALIVKAVNSHDKLVEAVRVLRERLDITDGALGKLLPILLQSNMEGSGMTVSSLIEYNQKALTQTEGLV